MGLEDISIGIEATGADTTADQINKVTQAIKGIPADSPGLAAVATSLNTIQTAATGVNAPLTTAATGVKTLGDSYDEAATKSKSLESAFTDLGSSTQSTSQNFQSFASSMVGLVGSIASISSGIIGIAQGYTEMERAQTLAQRSSDRYQQSLQTEQNLRDKLNKLIGEGKGNTAEAAKVEEQIALAHSKTATALETLNNNQARANEVTATFYSQVIPQAVGVLGGLATAINTIPTAWDKIKNALSGSNIFGGLKADVTDITAAQKDTSAAANDVGAALNTEGAAANTAATATRSLKVEALALAAPFLASAAAVVGFSLAKQKIGENAPAVHDFFASLDTTLDGSTTKVKGWATDFGDALASTGAFFNDNVKQIESWGGLNKSVMNASADEVQKYSDEFARTGQSESYYWDLRFKQWKQAADDSHQSYSAIAKDNIDQMREDQNHATSSQQAADAVAAAKKKEEDATKHYQEIVKDTAKVLQDDLSKSLDTLTQESTGVIKTWEQFGSSGTTVRTAFVDLNKDVQDVTKGLISHNQFADETIKVLTPLQGIAAKVGGTFQTEYNAALLSAIKVHSGVTDSIQPIIDHLKAMDDATHTVNAGIYAQKQALHDAGLAMIATDGKIRQLEKTIQDGTQLQQSFNKGQQDAYQAMLTNEEAIANEAGSVTKYYAELATGRPLNDAFIKGFTDQAKAFGDQAVAIADTQGKFQAYFEALQTGIPQTFDFAQGSQAQYQALLDLESQVDKTEGKIIEYYRELQTGEPQTLAFKQGAEEQKQALIDSTLAVDKENGMLAELFDQLKTGVPQQTAFAKGFDDATKALLDQNTQIETAEGKLRADEEIIRTHLSIVNDTTQGYIKGRQSIDDWSRSIDESAGSVKGTHDGLQTLINDYGITFPGAVIKTNTEMQTWIGIVRGAPSDIDTLNKSIDSLGNEFDTKLYEAVQGGTKTFDDFIKGLPAQIKAGLSPSALQAAFTIGQGEDILKNFKETLSTDLHGIGTDPNIIGSLQYTVNSNIATMEQAVKSNPKIGAIFQPIFDWLQQHPPKTVEDYQKVVALLDAAYSNLSDSTANSNLGLASVNQTAGLTPGAIDPATKSVQAFSDTWASLVQQSNEATSGTTLTSRFAGTAINTGGTGFKIPVPDATDFNTAMDTATTKVNALPATFKTAFDTAGQNTSGLVTNTKTNLDNFLSGLSGLNDALKQMPGFFKTQFGQAGTNVGDLATNAKTPLSNFQSGLQGLNDALTQMPGFFRTQFQTAGSNISALNTAAATPLSNFTGALQQLDGALTRLPGAFQTAFNQAGQNVNAMNTASAAAFQTMSSRIQQLMAQLQQLAQATAQIGQQTQAGYTPYQGAFAPQTGQAGYYTPYQGVFAQHGFVGVVDKPTSFVVGEAGPEYVSVIPGGGAGQISNILFTGLQDITTNITKANTAMSATNAVVTKNNTALNDSTLAQNLHNRALDAQSIKLTLTNLAFDASNVVLALLTKAIDTTSHALAGSGLATAADTTSGSLQQMGNFSQVVGQTVFATLPQYVGTGAATAQMGQQAQVSSGALNGMSGAAQGGQSSLQGLGSAGQQTSGSLQGLGSSGQQAGSSLNQTSGAAGQASQGLNSAGQSANSAGGSISGFSSQMQQAGQAASSFAQAANSAATSIASAARAATAAPAASGYGGYGSPYGGAGGGYPSTLSGYNPSTNPQLGQFYANQNAGYNPYYQYPSQTPQAQYYAPYGAQYFGFAKGFEGFVTSPTKFVAGEAGPEYVSVIPGANVDVGNTMTTGLSGLVNTINKSNSAMSTTWAAATNNTIMFNKASGSLDANANACDNVTDALGNHHTALINDQTGLVNSTTALNNATNALSNTTSSLNTTTTAANNTATSLFPVLPAAVNTITGLNGTTGAANGTTGSLNSLTSAAGSLASAIKQIIQTPGGGGVAGGGGGGIGGGVQGSAGPFAGLAAQIGPGGGGAVPAVFAPYAQYGNFSGQSPAAAPGTAYYGGPPTGGGGGGGGQYGAFGGLAQYGNFSGQSPAPAQGAAYYGGPPTQQGSPQGAFGAYSQYGNFGGGQPQGQAQGGVQGPQGGSSSPANQQPKQAATGWEGILTSATRFIAGEGGPEHVSIKPVTATTSTSDINSIIQLIAELVRQLQNQSMNINLNSYLDGYSIYKNQQKYTNGRLGNYLG
jgi:hypothetical protein